MIAEPPSGRSWGGADGTVHALCVHGVETAVKQVPIAIGGPAAQPPRNAGACTSCSSPLFWSAGHDADQRRSAWWRASASRACVEASATFLAG